MKTLFYRILNSFILIILFTTLLSTSIEFLSTKNELPKLLTEVRTKNIAHILGASYTQGKGWSSLQDSILWIEQENIKQNSNPSIRIIIRDREGKTLYNSFTQLSLKSDSPLIEGGSVPILDFKTGGKIGTVTAYIDKNYLKKETVDYILSILKPRLIGGGITILIAFFAASLLSRSITKPITALTNAAEEISLNEDSPPLPVNSQNELGRMSESFNRMVHSMERQKELRKRLINDVTHEILTPLNHIRLEARGLLDEITIPKEGAVQIINKVDYMKDLIQDLDWLAETDSGEYKLKKENFHLDTLIKKEVKNWSLKVDATRKNIVLINLPLDMPFFYGDPLRLSQALGNLIENALKYSLKGSQIKISCVIERNMAVISVTNQGEGISDKDKLNLFERFYQADTARTPGTGGRGLGLAIVKQIIELHNGRVWFTSIKNLETTFFISLPLQKQ